MLAITSLHEAIHGVLDIPPAGFRAHADGLTPAELDALQSQMYHAAQYLTRAASYFGSRQLGLDHEHSVRSARKAVTAVRRALGYTYADDDLSF